MRVLILYAVVTFQILIFQFVAVRFLKAIPEYFVGKDELPDKVAEAVREFRHSLATGTYTLGAALWIGMTVGVYVLPFTRVAADRLIMMAVSLVSSGILLWTYVRAGRKARGIADMLPDSGRRIASLERRTLGRYYSVAWEFLPFVILTAAAIFTFWAVPQLDAPYPTHYDSSGIPDQWGEGPGRFVALLIMQAVIAVGLLGLTFSVVRERPGLSPKAPIAAESPSQAERLSEGTRRRELRFFMAAKVLVALQIGLILVLRLRTALGHVPSFWMAGAPWVVTLLLLVVFGMYAAQAARSRGKERKLGINFG